MKKVDIVLPKSHLDRVIEHVEGYKIGGYTVIDVVEGKGPRSGPTLNHSWTGDSNVYLFLVCSDEVATALSVSLRPLLKQHRGAAFISTVDESLI